MPPSEWDNADAREGPSGNSTSKGGLEFNVTHQAGVVAIIGCTTPTVQLPSVATPTSPSTPTPLSARLNNVHLDLTGHDTTSDLDHYGPDQVHVRVGVDIACADEDKRTPKDMTTQAKFDEWVDIFGEMFSERERWNMRHAPVHLPVAEREEGVWASSDESSASEAGDGEAARLRRARDTEARATQLKLRRFYAYWALKEAYIKMVGEGLLADWLKELEFLDVVAPPPALHATGRHGARNGKSGSRSRSRGTSHGRTMSHGHVHHAHHHSLSTGVLVDPAAEEAAKWTDPAKAETGMVTSLRGKRLDDVDIELVAYDDDFLLATATRGVVEIFDDDDDDEKEKEMQNGVQAAPPQNGIGAAQHHATSTRGRQRRRWIMLDIERDIRPCAEGRCKCLD